MGRAAVDVTANAEAQLRVLVQHLARMGAGRTVLQVGGNQCLVGERLRHVAAHLLLGGGPGVGLQRFTDVGGELRQRVRHRSSLHSMDRRLGRRAMPWLAIRGTRLPYMRNAAHQAYFPSCTIPSAIVSAVMRVGKLVLAQGTRGKIEASTTRRPSTPRTRPCASVTAMGSPSAPIRQLQEACHTPIAALRTNASQASSSPITSSNLKPSVMKLRMR